MNLGSTPKGTVAKSLPFRRVGSLSSTAPNDSIIDFHPSGSLPFSGHFESLSGKVGTNPTAMSTIAMADANRMYAACYRRGGEAIGAGTRVLTTDDNGATYTETNTLDDLGLVTATPAEYMVIVHPTPFYGVFLHMNAVNTGSANTMRVAYWNGTWTETLDVAGLELEDGTHDGTRSLQKSGTVRISKYWATKMTPGTFGGVTGYALRIGFVTAALDSGCSLTAAHAISDYSHYIEIPHAEQVEYAFGTLDGGTTLTASHGVGAVDLDGATADTDYMLVGSSQPFMGVGVNMDGSNVNSEASTLLTVNYWGGSTTGWTGGLLVSGGAMTDGTANTVSFDQDGLVLWDPGICSLMQKTTIGGITAYWVQFMWDVTLSASTATASLYTVRAEGVRYPHYFHKYERTRTGRDVLVDATARLRHSDSVSMRAVQIDTCDTSYAAADFDFEGLFTNHTGAERSSDPTLEVTV